MASQETSKELKAKKPSLPSRKEVDDKFRLRGVSPVMIRDATGVEKMDVTDLRALLLIFEEAHERGWDVANAPWAHAVEFYQKSLSMTLPEVEPGPRESLIKDFLKRCWEIFMRSRKRTGWTRVGHRCADHGGCSSNNRGCDIEPRIP